jgi:hypothetical protein
MPSRGTTLKHRQFASAATDIDTSALRIVEHVVRVTAYRKLLAFGASGDILQQQHRRRTEHAGEQRLRWIERHREIGVRIFGWPGCQHPPRGQVHYGNLSRIGDVDIGVAGRRIDLKPLRMRW